MPCRTRHLLVIAVAWLTLHAALLPPAAAGPFEPKEIALHEGGHAKDFTRRDWPGTYAFVTALPFGDLWPEAIATGDALAYVQQQEDPQLAQESYRILYPAYGTYLGGNVANLFSAPIALPVYASALAAGHVAGRMKAGEVDTTPAAPSWESEALENDDEAISAVALEPAP